MLPLPAATHVRDKNPESAMEAAKLADLFFADRHSTPDYPRWMMKLFQAREDQEDFTKRYFPPDLNGQHEVGKDNKDTREDKSVTFVNKWVKGPQCFRCHE